MQEEFEQPASVPNKFWSHTDSAFWTKQNFHYRLLKLSGFSSYCTKLHDDSVKLAKPNSAHCRDHAQHIDNLTRCVCRNSNSTGPKSQPRNLLVLLIQLQPGQEINGHLAEQAVVFVPFLPGNRKQKPGGGCVQLPPLPSWCFCPAVACLQPQRSLASPQPRSVIPLRGVLRLKVSYWTRSASTLESSSSNSSTSATSTEQAVTENREPACFSQTLCICASGLKVRASYLVLFHVHLIWANSFQLFSCHLHNAN